MISRYLLQMMLLLVGTFTFAQTFENPTIIKGEKHKYLPPDPLSPAKAAFYSAILPGLGQAYNKSYWKIPIVYGAMGWSIYAYLNNSYHYNRYRNAYKRRLDGFTDDEFYGNRPDGRPRFSEEVLRNGQLRYQKNKELSMLITIGLYALNILEANVHAHLKQYNIDDNLAMQPFLTIDNPMGTPQWGVSLNFKF